MEGTLKRLSRRFAARPAVVLLTVGAVSVGVAACGSDSSSDSSDATGSTSPVVEKQAGYRDVELNLINKSPERLLVFLCQDTNALGHGPCGDGTSLETGEATHLTSAAVGGIIHFQNGPSMEFRAKNPDIGEPSFRIWPQAGDTDANQQASAQYNLEEGQIVEVPGANDTVPNGWGSHLFDMERAPDTDVIRMGLTVLH